MRETDFAIFAGVMLALTVWAYALAPADATAPAPDPTEPSVVYEFTEATEAPTEPTTEPATEPVEITEVPTTAPTEPPVDQDDLEMLACVIYQEAGGNAICDDCRRRVADVVLNRVADPRFPDTIEAVLTAPRQYGTLHQTGVRWPARASSPTESEAVARAYRIAEEVLRGHHSELYGAGYVWQAGFVQGRDNVQCCGIYFGR